MLLVVQDCAVSRKSQLMPPAKRRRLVCEEQNGHAEMALAAAPQPGPGGVNDAYYSEVAGALNTVLEFFGFNLLQEDPLPLISADPNALTGIVAPYAEDVYDQKMMEHEAGIQLNYTCGLNFFWLDILGSLAPHIPQYVNRVYELKDQLICRESDGPCKQYDHHVLASWTKGSLIPKGRIQTLSPDELAHATVLAVAELISSGKLRTTKSKEGQAWLKQLLSTPVSFQKCDTADERFVAMQNNRQFLVGTGLSVQITVRQLIYCLVGYRDQKIKEQTGGDPKKKHNINAKTMAQLWTGKICQHPLQLEKISASTIDQAFTIHDRLLAIPEVEKFLIEDEAARGPTKAAFRKMTTLQEVINRCRSTANIKLFFALVRMQLLQGYLRPDEIVVQAIKGGNKQSISDMVLYQVEIREELLGPFMKSHA